MVKEKEGIMLDDIQFVNDTVMIDVIVDTDSKNIEEEKNNTSYIDDVVFWF